VVRSWGSYCSRIFTTDQVLNGISAAGVVVLVLLLERLVPCEGRERGELCFPFAPFFFVVTVFVSAGFPFLKDRLDFRLCLELVFFFESLDGGVSVSDSIDRTGDWERG
jgi:hypothetical protein